METRPLISVVDDDESVRESLPDLLKEFGFNAQAFLQSAGLAKKMQAPGKRTEAEVVALTAERREIDAKWPVPRATFDDFMKHVLHAIDVAGINHVGMSGDFDGGGGLAGLEDVTDYPKITAALLKAGYSKDDVAKFWGGNVLRVMREAQALAEKPR